VPKIVSEMPAAQVHRLDRPGYHRVGGVSGLALQIGREGSERRSWVLRVKIGLKKADLGLGGFPEVGLAEARERAREAKRLIRQGIDPRDHWKAQREALVAAQQAEVDRLAKIMTFDQAAKGHYAGKASKLKNPKHKAQWQSTIKTYISPHFGSKDVADITADDVAKALAPIWLTKHETADRVRNRVKAILDWAKTKGHRAGDNPAEFKGRLEHLLPEWRGEEKNHKALPFDEMAGFMGRLKTQAGDGARALELTVLCATRSGETRAATWSQIDLDAKIWTIPAENTKTGKEHRVPLSEAAMSVLGRMEKVDGTDLIFGAQTRKMLSDMTLLAVTKRMEVKCTVHGFRSTFRDWCAEKTDFENHVCEMALAHTIKNKAERAYRRGDLFEKRKELMDAWAEFCGR